MGRTPCCSRAGGKQKKGPWTPEEDLRLTKYIEAHGEGQWRTLPKKAGLDRCGKGCRLRWMNYLRPNVKRGNISVEEEELIIRLHKLLGNRWSLIAGRVPGRTDNEIKNYWNIHLSKRHHSQTKHPKNPNPSPTISNTINNNNNHNNNIDNNNLNISSTTNMDNNNINNSFEYYSGQLVQPQPHDPAINCTNNGDIVLNFDHDNINSDYYGLNWDYHGSNDWFEPGWWDSGLGVCAGDPTAWAQPCLNYAGLEQLRETHMTGSEWLMPMPGFSGDDASSNFVVGGSETLFGGEQLFNHTDSL
ncbi:hypothetical protein AMTRI_Chr01g113210 [Amborella trichopoda]